MLIEFTVGNFRSFKEPVTLSMVAANTKARDPQVNENNTIVVDNKLTLLTSAAVYGANASGKSNFINAMAFMKHFILSSSKESVIDEPIRIIPFRLSTVTENQPSFFQISFLLEDIKYRYGFEATRGKVVSEWLFAAPSQKESRLFFRDETGIHVSRSFREGKGLEEKTRPNALFLSVVAQWNGPMASKLLSWFRSLQVISGLNDTSYQGLTVKSFEDGSYRQEIVKLVKSLDLGIEDISSEKMGDDKYRIFVPENTPSGIREVPLDQFENERVLIHTAHKKYDETGLPVSSETFDLRSDESAGTEKLFYMTGPLLDGLSNGSILFIDEMEARLHPLITRALIGLFNSKETNPKGAQLIFTTHDTNLLSNKILRRDQIWFVEKDHYGCCHLYSLAELKVRNDALFENEYFEGRYGAVPFLGNVRQISIEEIIMPERRFLEEGKVSYKRRVNRFEPRQRFLIVCEGKKTEPNYFKKFPIPPDSVADVEGAGANTDGLVRVAIRLKATQKYDQVWVVFDRDSFTPEHFNNAIQLANTNGIRAAYSNEAFELWYCLHFHYLDTGITREDYCAQLNRPGFLGKKYEKNSETIYDDIFARQAFAIRNARKLLEQYNPPNPVLDKPSTTVHLLVEQLNRLTWH